jgi:DNA-binding GntR family transcriptional regulator
VSQQELADAVGSVRDVIARNLGQLRDEGLIATRPTRIAILDPIRLREVAVRPGDEARSPAMALGVSEAAAS